MTSVALLQAEDLHFSYGPDVHALRGIDISLELGRSVALIGQNGSGKTTLAKLLAGIHEPSQGRVLLNGEDLRTLSPGSRAHGVGFVFQNPDHQLFSPTVREEIAFGPRNLGWPEAAVEEKVEQLLEEFDLVSSADNPPASLSFGLRRKVSVAAILALQPRILMLDEPAIGLDARSADQLMGSLASRMNGEHSLLFISHDMEIVARYADRCLLLREGRVVADGPTTAVLSNIPLLEENRLAAPPVVQLQERLADLGFSGDLVTVEALATELTNALAGRGG